MKRLVPLLILVLVAGFLYLLLGGGTLQIEREESSPTEPAPEMASEPALEPSDDPPQQTEFREETDVEAGPTDALAQTDEEEPGFDLSDDAAPEPDSGAASSEELPSPEVASAPTHEAQPEEEKQDGAWRSQRVSFPRFVAVDGSDRGSGTEASPWATLGHALEQASPGTTIRLGPGTFYEEVTIRRSGREGDPIIIEGTLGENGERLTRLAGGQSVDPDTWEPAPEVGPNVFKNESFSYNPPLLTIDNREVAHVHRNKGVDFRGRGVIGVPRRDDASYGSLGMEVLDLPEDHVIPRRDDLTIPFWDTMRAVYVHDPTEQITYLRMAGGKDPREQAIAIAPARAVMTIDNASHLEIRDMEISRGDVGITLTGNQTRDILIENCAFIHGRSRIHITEGASGIRIKDNYFTIGSYFDVRPGAWGGPGYNELAAQREYLYNFFKQLHGHGTSSDDCSIRIDSAAHDIEIEGNHMDGGLIAIRMVNTRDVFIRDNRVNNHSSVGILVTDTVENIHLAGNHVHDNNINFRLQRLNHGGPREVYIYGNRSSQPRDLGTHIFCHAHEQRAFSPHPIFIFYHNTFLHGSRIFNVVNQGRMPEGLPGFQFLNNVLATNHRAYSASEGQARDEETVGVFDYNWVGGEYPQGVPAWFGRNNIQAEGQPPWTDAEDPDFVLPSEHRARKAGLDLSRPFTIEDQEFDPLPGMEPGYFNGDQPDMGAVQHESDWGASFSQSP